METADKGLFVHLDAIRGSTIDLVADAAESVYRARQALGRDPVDQARPDQQSEASPRGERPDFLYDFTRLSLDYANQLIRIGGAYAFLPSRIMERLCA